MYSQQQPLIAKIKIPLQEQHFFGPSIVTLLCDSGWTGAVTEAGVRTVGTAESFLSASNITRTREAPQVTVCCLYKLLKEAHEEFYEEEHLTLGLGGDWVSRQGSKVHSLSFDILH